MGGVKWKGGAGGECVWPIEWNLEARGVRGSCCLHGSANRATQELAHRISIYYQNTGGLRRQHIQVDTKSPMTCRSLLSLVNTCKNCLLNFVFKGVVGSGQEWQSR